MRNNISITNRYLLRIVVAAVIFVLAVTTVFMPVEVNAASKKAKVTYSVKVSNINSNTVIKKGTKLKVVYTATKKKKGKKSKAKVKFKSSNKKVATISKKGVIKAKKKGTTYITVYCKAKPSKYKRVKLRVGIPVSSIKVSGFKYLGKGHSATLKAKPNSNATNKSVSWKSSNKSVATVSSNGKVSAKGYGEATIYATSKDGSKVVGERTIIVHKYLKDEALWIAHRGLHTSAKENTAEAFKAAGEADFHAAECDIWETKKETPDTELPDRYIADEEDSSNLPEIPDVTELAQIIGELPGPDASYYEILDCKHDIYDAWDKYEELTAGLSELQNTLIREELIATSHKDLLETLFNHYTKVYGYDSMDLVINHNSTFSNGTKVKSLTAEQIGKKISYACFLSEYLDICKSYGMIPVIELKDPAMSKEAVRKVIEIIDSKDMLDRVYLISFYEDVLTEAKELSEEKMGGDSPTTYYLFSSNAESKLETAFSEGYTGISVRKDVITESIYNSAKEYGMGVGTWTYANDAGSDEYLGKHILSGNYALDFITVDYKVYKN